MHQRTIVFGAKPPTIITICGSTRFKDEITRTAENLTMFGYLVISMHIFGHTDMPDADWSTGATRVKCMLDELHRRKIDLADTVFVVNPGGYIGESTMNEIRYARATGKRITYSTALTAEQVALMGEPDTDEHGNKQYPAWMSSRHSPAESCDCSNPDPGKPYHCAAAARH